MTNSEPTVRATLEIDDEGRTVVRTSDQRPDPPVTDWDAVEALTDDEILAGAEGDPDAVILTPERRRLLRPVPNPRAIREGLGLTQEAFAHQFDIPLGTLRDWEQRRRHLDAAARTLFRTIAASPDAVRAAVRGAAANHADHSRSDAAKDPAAE